MPYAYRTPICVWDSKTIPYTYGISHTHIGRPIRIWDKICVLYRTEVLLEEDVNISNLDSEKGKDMGFLRTEDRTVQEQDKSKINVS